MEQVNQAVTELDEITQQNAVLAEQASGASHTSRQLADNMADIVNFFEIEDPHPTASNQIKIADTIPTAVIPAETAASAGHNKEPLFIPLDANPAAAAPVATKKATVIAATAAPVTVSTDEDDEWREF